MTRKLVFVYCFLIIMVFTTEAFCAKPLVPAGSSQGPDIFVQKGHSTNVNTIDFSPDGKYLVSGSSDKNIKLWDVETGREIRTFVARDMVDFVAFSPDGQSLLSLESKGGAALWNVKTGREIRRLGKKGKPLLAIAAAFSPDGTSLAVVGGQDEKVPGGDLTFRNIQLLDLNTGRELMIFKGHTSSIHTIAFSPDGKYLASGSETPNLNKGKKDDTVRLWEVKSGKEIHRFAGHTEGVSKVAFSPDGQFVASIGEDRNIFFWNVGSGKQAKALSGFPAGSVKTNGTIAFSPDGRRFVAVSSFPPVMILWDMVTGQVEAGMTDDHKLDDAAVRFSPDGRLIAVSATDKVSLWDAAKHRKIRSFGGDVQGINLAFFSADQEQVKIAGNEELAVFDRRQGRLTGRRTIEPFDNWWAKGQNEWGNRRFFKIIDKGYQVIDSRTDRAIISDAADRYPTAYDSPQQAVTFSPDGRYALVAEKDGGKVSLLDVRSRRSIELVNFPDHVSLSSSDGYAAFSPDGSLVAAASYSHDEERGVLVIWNTATGKQSIRLRANQKREGFSQVAFTADSKQIVAAEGGNQGILGLWDLTSGREIRSFPGHPGFITSLALSGDGKFVVSGDWIGTVKLWNLRQGGEVKTFKGHTDEIKSLAFSRDGNYILSASKDGTARQWDIASGKEIAQFVSFTNGEWIVITPEGYFNASPGGAKHLNVRIGLNVYSIDNLFEKFFNPVYVASVLQGKKVEATADIRKGILSPPEVRITSPAAGSVLNTDTLAVAVAARDTGGGIDEIRLYHNGKVVGGDQRAVKIVPRGGETVRQYSVSLVDGANTFRAVGFSRDRTESNPYELMVRLKAPSKEVSLYVLAVGINKYKNPALNLNYAEPDAKSIAGFFSQRGGGLFRKVNIREIYSEQATRENIVSQLNELQNTNPQDAVLIYLAGHGESLNDKWYFIPHELTYPEREADVRTKGVSSDDLSGYIKNIKAQKILLLVDACKSGAVLIAFRGFEDRKALSQLSRSTGVHVVAASTKDQFAAEVKDLGHGVFTYTLLAGLGGKAAGPGEPVTVRKLMVYVEEQLPEITKKYKQEAQYPVVDSRGMDFPLVLGR